MADTDNTFSALIQQAHEAGTPAQSRPILDRAEELAREERDNSITPASDPFAKLKAECRFVLRYFDISQVQIAQQPSLAPFVSGKASEMVRWLWKQMERLPLVGTEIKVPTLPGILGDLAACQALTKSALEWCDRLEEDLRATLPAICEADQVSNSPNQPEPPTIDGNEKPAELPLPDAPTALLAHLKALRREIDPSNPKWEVAWVLAPERIGLVWRAMRLMSDVVPEAPKFLSLDQRRLVSAWLKGTSIRDRLHPEEVNKAIDVAVAWCVERGASDEGGVTGRADPFACRGCGAIVPEQWRVLPSVPCQECGRWECRTGIHRMAVASASGPPSVDVQLHAPCWFPRLPANIQGQPEEPLARKHGVDGKNTSTPKATRRRLEDSPKESDQRKLQVYNYIVAEHQAGKKPAKILADLKANRDRREQVKAAGLELNKEMVKAALTRLGQSERDKKRKQQDSSAR